jgi:hypothetical protein
MNATIRDLSASTEERIQNAITEFKEGRFKSIRVCADTWQVSKSTVAYRMSGRNSRARSHEYRQILSSTEEKTLVRWLTRLTSAGFPASPALAIEMAEEIRRLRFRLTSTPTSLRLIGKHWLDRFRIRHPEIQGVWTRQIDGVRHNTVILEAVKTYFEATTELCLQHQYPPERRYNMDESGFAVGVSQSSRALVNIREGSNWKVVKGRQEWITAIECISAAGVALPPLLIYKAKYTNTGWIPTDTPSDWHFSTSASGWTSNSHGFEWLTRVFEPVTRPDDPSQRRLLVADGHSSHITANVIAFAMEHAIDLLILPPHCSHVLQPLDVGVFSPLKRALAAETDRVSRLDPGRIARVEWTSMYIRARAKALTLSNIQSGWRATGLEPLSPITVLDKIASKTTPAPSDTRTVTNSESLDFSLLNSSPPEGTELQQANALLNAALRDADTLRSPVKRYTARMTRAFEATQSELVAVRKELANTQELLRTRKARKTGKRVALQGRFVFSTQEVLEIARQAEESTAKKKDRKRRQQRSPSPTTEEEIEEDPPNSDSDYDSDCIYVARK